MPKGWILYNLTLSNHQSLLVTATSNESALSLLRDASEEYMLSGEIADIIIISSNYE